MSEQEINRIITENINAFIEKRNLTQKEVAEYVGVSQGTVSEWCKGKKTPRMTKFDKLCELFRCSREDLMRDSRTAVVDPEKERIQALQEQLRDNPAIGMLLSAAKDLSEDDIAALADMAKRLRSTYKD